MFELHFDGPDHDLGFGQNWNIVPIIRYPDLKIVLILEDPTFLNDRAEPIGAEPAVTGLDSVTPFIFDAKWIELLVQKAIDLVGSTRFGIRKVQGSSVIKGRKDVLDRVRRLVTPFFHAIDAGPPMFSFDLVLALKKGIILFDDVAILIDPTDEDPREDSLLIHIGFIAVPHLVEPVEPPSRTSLPDHV